MLQFFSNGYTDEYANNYINDNYSLKITNDYAHDNYPSDYSTDYTNNNFVLISVVYNRTSTLPTLAK